MPATQISVQSEVSLRYAVALFDLAQEQDAIDDVEADIKTLQDTVGQSADLQRLLCTPVYTRKAQEAALSFLMERLDLCAVVRQLVGLVAQNGRLHALLDIITAFLRLVAQDRGEIVAQVSAAAPLTQAQVNRLRLELEAGTGKSVDLTTQVDPDLLGGLVVKIGSHMVDSSIRTQLNRLKFLMKEA